VKQIRRSVAHVSAAAGHAARGRGAATTRRRKRTAASRLGTPTAQPMPTSSSMALGLVAALVVSARAQGPTEEQEALAQESTSAGSVCSPETPSIDDFNHESLCEFAPRLTAPPTPTVGLLLLSLILGACASQLRSLTSCGRPKDLGSAKASRA
jgi:hypothetical protein